MKGLDIERTEVVPVSPREGSVGVWSTCWLCLCGACHKVSEAWLAGSA